MNRYRILAGLALSLITTTSVLAAPASYAFDTTHSRIAFYVSHLGFSNSIGELRVGAGALVFDSADWSKSSVQVNIPVQSLDFGDSKWNSHVLGVDFLNSAKFPTMTFVSSRVEKIDATHGKLYGDLTIKGVTKPVVLDLRLNKVGEHPMRRVPAAGFTATTSIRRSDYGIVAYLPSVGDDIDIRIEIESFVDGP
jgi:polyisoprenoid-binding protein YceI